MQFVEAQKQAVFLTQSVKHANVIRGTGQFAVQAGSSDFNRVYTTQASIVVTQQDQLASTQGNIALQLIAVYRALGGGWEYFRAGNGMPQLTQPLPPKPEAAAITNRRRYLPLPEPIPPENHVVAFGRFVDCAQMPYGIAAARYPLLFRPDVRTGLFGR